MPVTQSATAAPEKRYLISDLEELGFNRWTIRSYIKQGILPRANGRGRTAFYTDVHVNVLIDIKRTREQRRLLADIAESSRKRFPHAYSRRSA